MPQRFGPGEPLDAKPGDTFGEYPRGSVVWFDRHRLFGQRDCAKPAYSTLAQARARSVEIDFFARLDAIGETCLDFAGRDRCREQDAAGSGAAGKFGYSEIRLTRQRGSGIDLGAAAICQHKRSGGAAAILGNALGIGQREQAPQRSNVPLPLVGRG